MCTAATYQTRNFYFGRNLDYERSYGESVVITPRNWPLALRRGAVMETHYAMIGMAHMQDGFPLYYDAVNEKGLCIAGLNFVGNAVYHPPVAERENVAQFELIPWLLGRCATLTEARQLLEQVNITDTPFCTGLPAAQLHWMVAGRRLSRGGVGGRRRPCLRRSGGGADQQPAVSHAAVRPEQLRTAVAGAAGEPLRAGPAAGDIQPRHGGHGPARGLSSQSRFVRAAFVRANSVSGDGEAESLSQLFHILGSVEQQRGCCRLNDGACELTLYTGCCNADRGVYYYTTYDNGQITAVDMHRADLDGDAPVSYPLVTEMQVRWEN